MNLGSLMKLEYFRNESQNDHLYGRLCLNDFLDEGNWFQSLKFEMNVSKAVKPIGLNECKN